MTRIDLLLVTQTILGLVDGKTGYEITLEQRRFVAERFAYAIAQTHPRFDAERFLLACGVAI